MLSNAPLICVNQCSTIDGMGTHIRERIKAARDHACLTQEQLAERIGITKSAVSMWESKNPKKWTRPTYENLQVLSQVTGAGIEWLVSDESNIDSDWTAPAEVFFNPPGKAAPAAKELEALALFKQLQPEDQDQMLAYMRMRSQIPKG